MTVWNKMLKSAVRCQQFSNNPFDCKKTKQNPFHFIIIYRTNSHQYQQLPTVKQHAGRIVQFSSGWICTSIPHKGPLCANVYQHFSELLPQKNLLKYFSLCDGVCVCLLHDILPFFVFLCLHLPLFFIIWCRGVCRHSHPLPQTHSLYSFTQRSQAEL